MRCSGRLGWPTLSDSDSKLHFDTRAGLDRGPMAFTRKAVFDTGSGGLQFWLEIRWGIGPTVAWLLLNPGNLPCQPQGANTLRAMRRISCRARAGRLIAVNIFPIVASDPQECLKAIPNLGAQVMRQNLQFIQRASRAANTCVVAFGAKLGGRFEDGVMHDGKFPEKVNRAINALRGGHGLNCIGENANGSPRHPRGQFGAGLVPWPPHR